MEGKRVEKRQGGAKKAGIIACAVVAVLVAAYLGLCAWVGASNRIMPNVSISGVDVSGMTAEQAAAAVQEAVETYADEASVTLHHGIYRWTLTCTELQTDEHGSGTAALEAGRGSFLTQGFQYLRHLLGGSSQVALDLGTAAMEQPALEQLLEQADQTVNGSVVQMAYQVDGDQLVVTKGVTGAAFDRADVAQMVADAINEAVEDAIDRKGASEVQVDLSAQDALIETPPQEPDFDAVYQEIYVAPQDAEVDPETYEVTDHVTGLDFDVDALKSAYEAAAEGTTFTIPLTLTEPQETKESLSAKLFADLLGQGTTTVSGSANRRSNVKLSAAACNGIILMPGEEFSYNNTTGSRSADKGYLSAPVYSGGASVDEVGGGICQTSSTIYYAVLHTNLEVVERRAHMYNTGYVTEGMDATVYYGVTDFRFKNNTDYPVKLVTEYYQADGKWKLTVKLYGTNEEGIYAVPKSTTYDWVSPSTQYKADESVPQGTTRVDTKQNAYTGVKAQTYRYIYSKDGSLLETQDMGVSSYKSRPKTILYNPADGDPATWVNGEPPKPTTDPGSSENAASSTGTETDPEAGTEPGTADPVDPVDPPADSGADSQPEETSGTDPEQAAESKPEEIGQDVGALGPAG